MVVAGGGDIFFVGQTASFGAGDKDAIVMRVSPSGEAFSASAWATNDVGMFTNEATLSDLTDVTSSMIVQTVVLGGGGIVYYPTTPNRY